LAVVAVVHVSGESSVRHPSRALVDASKYQATLPLPPLGTVQLNRDKACHAHLPLRQRRIVAVSLSRSPKASNRRVPSARGIRCPLNTTASAVHSAGKSRKESDPKSTVQRQGDRASSGRARPSSHTRLSCTLAAPVHATRSLAHVPLRPFNSPPRHSSHPAATTTLPQL
jgi:hypothetical protein